MRMFFRIARILLDCCGPASGVARIPIDASLARVGPFPVRVTQGRGLRHPSTRVGWRGAPGCGLSRLGPRQPSTQSKSSKGHPVTQATRCSSTKDALLLYEGRVARRRGPVIRYEGRVPRDVRVTLFNYFGRTSLKSVNVADEQREGADEDLLGGRAALTGRAAAVDREAVVAEDEEQRVAERGSRRVARSPRRRPRRSPGARRSTLPRAAWRRASTRSSLWTSRAPTRRRRTYSAVRPRGGSASASTSPGARSASTPRAIVSSCRIVVVGQGAPQEQLVGQRRARSPSRATRRSSTSRETSQRIASTRSIRACCARRAAARCGPAMSCTSRTMRGRLVVDSEGRERVGVALREGRAKLVVRAPARAGRRGRRRWRSRGACSSR